LRRYVSAESHEHHHREHRTEARQRVPRVWGVALEHLTILRGPRRRCRCPRDARRTGPAADRTPTRLRQRSRPVWATPHRRNAAVLQGQAEVADDRSFRASRHRG
jgi:hypothetical protein